MKNMLDGDAPIPEDAICYTHGLWTLEQSPDASGFSPLAEQQTDTLSVVGPPDALSNSRTDVQRHKLGTTL